MIQLSGTDLAASCDFNERCLKEVVVTWKLPLRVEEACPDAGSTNVHIDDGDWGLDGEVTDDPRCRLQTDAGHVLGEPVAQWQRRRRRLGGFEQINGANDSNSTLTREPIPNRASPTGDREGCTQSGLDEFSVGFMRQQTLLPESIECGYPDIARHAPATEQARDNLFTEICTKAKVDVLRLPTLIHPESGGANLPRFPPREPGGPGVDASLGLGRDRVAVRRCVW